MDFRTARPQRCGRSSKPATTAFSIDEDSPTIRAATGTEVHTAERPVHVADDPSAAGNRPPLAKLQVLPVRFRPSCCRSRPVLQDLRDRAAGTGPAALPTGQRPPRRPIRPPTHFEIAIHIDFAGTLNSRQWPLCLGHTITARSASTPSSTRPVYVTNRGKAVEPPTPMAGLAKEATSRIMMEGSPPIDQSRGYYPSMSIRDRGDLVRPRSELRISGAADHRPFLFFPTTAPPAGKRAS